MAKLLASQRILIEQLSEQYLKITKLIKSILSKIIRQVYAAQIVQVL